MVFFFYQAEDGIRGGHVTGVQTCALPILQLLGMPNAWWIEVETAGSRCWRETEALISRPTWSRMIPALAMARSAASTTPCLQPLSGSFHQRRSYTPATRCRTPLGRRRRLRAGESISSIRSEERRA